MPGRTGARGLVILDRDGVINEDSRAFVKSPAEWLPLPGSIEAIATLSRAGYTVAVASNQSGLARGLFDRAAEGGKVARIVVCPHGPDDGCACRKPLPGLLTRLARHFGTTLDDVQVVGDSLRDLQAAVSAGAQPVLVRTGNGEKTLRELPEAWRHGPVYRDLAAFAADATRG